MCHSVRVLYLKILSYLSELTFWKEGWHFPSYQIYSIRFKRYAPKLILLFAPFQKLRGMGETFVHSVYKSELNPATRLSSTNITLTRWIHHKLHFLWKRVFDSRFVRTKLIHSITDAMPSLSLLHVEFTINHIFYEKGYLTQDTLELNLFMA